MIPATCSGGIITSGLTHCGEVIPARIIIPAKIHHNEFPIYQQDRKTFKTNTIRRR